MSTIFKDLMMSKGLLGGRYGTPGGRSKDVQVKEEELQGGDVQEKEVQEMEVQEKEVQEREVQEREVQEREVAIRKGKKTAKGKCLQPSQISTLLDMDEDEEEDANNKRKADEAEDQTPKKAVKVTHGVLSSPGIGFMRLAEDDSTKVTEETEKENEATIKTTKKPKKTAAEYLARQFSSKVEQRSTKANLNSMKTKFLTSVNNKHLFMCGIATNIFTKGLFTFLNF